MDGDGLYRVVTTKFVAGYVVEGGRVTRCAPILRSRIKYWMTVATKVDGRINAERRTGNRGANET